MKKSLPKNDVVVEAMKLLKKYKYKPKALWMNFEGTIVYIVTDDIDRSEFAKLIKKFK